MATDELKRVYITSDQPPPPPPGFQLDPSVAPAPPPPEGFIPDPIAAPYRGQQRMGNFINAQQDADANADDTASPERDAQPPPPPDGYVMDGPPEESMTPNLPPAATQKGLKIAKEMAEGLLNIPRRAIENSQESLNSGNYDPVPTMDAAMLTMGTGAIAGVPVKGAEAVLGAGPVRRIPAPTAPPPPSGYVLDGAAESLANDLHAVRQSNVADKVEMDNRIKSLPPEAIGDPIGEKLYHAAEDPAEYAKLTPEEKALSDQHLDPMRQEQFDLALEAKNLGGSDLIDDPNHMHRIAKGHARDYDSLSGGSSYDPVTGTKGLPQTTSALKARTFYTIEDAAGTRKVITPNDSGFTVWNNKVGTSVPSKADIKPGEVIDAGGRKWTVKQARTKEIEQHGQFQGNKPAEYHKNAFANTADAVVRLREVVRDLKFAKQVKGSQWWLQHAQKVGGNRKVPDGWVRPKMPLFNDWYVDPKIAHVLDDFYKPGLLGDIPAAQVLREINQFATSSMFWNPLGHIMNVAVHWTVGRGWDWIRPKVMRHFATDMTRAVKAVVSQNGDYQRFLRAGGGLIHGGIKQADFYRNMGRHMGMDIEKNWGAWKPLFDKLGLGASPAKAIAWWYSQMRSVLWKSSDIFMIHRYLELERKGYSTAKAIREAEKHIPNYRIPTYIGKKVLGERGSRLASMVAQEPALTNFARYHYGMWKSFMHMATDLAKGTKAEKKEALGNLAVLAFMGYFVYPAVDWIYQKTTGDPNAKLTRRGAMSVPHGLAEVSRGRESFSQFLQSNITPAPATEEILQQIFPNDAFTGQPMGGIVPRVEHGAEHLVSPYGTAAQLYRGGEGARSIPRTALDQVVGGENTSEKTEKGKQYGAMLRDRAARRHVEKPSGPIEGAYYGAKKAIGLEEPTKEPKAKKVKDPNAPKKSHHNKDKGY